MSSVWIYVDTNKEVGDKNHLKVFATTDAAERKRGLRRTIPKAWPLSMRFWNERGRQLRRPYFKINHKAAPAVAVDALLLAAVIRDCSDPIFSRLRSQCARAMSQWLICRRCRRGSIPSPQAREHPIAKPPG